MLAKMKANKDRVLVVVDYEEIARKEKEKADKDAKLAANIKKYAMKDGEIDADANPYQQDKKFLGISLPTVIFGKIPPDVAMLNLVMDPQGKLWTNMQLLQLKKSETKYLLLQWIEIVGKSNYKMGYKEFLSYFNIEDDIWIKRFFDIINLSFSGLVTFFEWIAFFVRYLVIDMTQTMEFSFRMLSRRGQVFDKLYSILDTEDMKIYLDHRYNLNSGAQRKKKAIDILCYIDRDGDGGLAFDEFEKFSLQNPVFCAYFHRILGYLRKCIFGTRSWVLRSRQIKKKKASTWDSISLGAKINLPSELYCKQCNDPCIDGQGKPIDDQVFVIEQQMKMNKEKEEKETAEREAKEAAEKEAAKKAKKEAKFKAKNAEDEEEKLLRFSRKKGDMSHIPKDISEDRDNLKSLLGITAKEAEEKLKAEEAARNGALNPDDVKKLPSKNCLLFKSELKWNKEPRRNYKEDFCDVVRMKQEEKLVNLQQKKKTEDLSNKMASRSYERVINVCKDLMTGRREIRFAFEQWLRVVGKESTVGKNSEETAIDLDALLAEAEEENKAAIQEMKSQLEDLQLRLDLFSKTGKQGGLDNIAEKMEVQDLYEEIHFRLMLKLGKGDQKEQKKNPSIHQRILESTKQQDEDNERDLVSAFQFDYTKAYEQQATCRHVTDTKIELLKDRAEAGGIKWSKPVKQPNMTSKLDEHDEGEDSDASSAYSV